jgi:uncharacterized paraquat-inducible protein A
MMKVQDILGGVWDMFKHTLMVLWCIFMFCWMLFPPTGLLTILIIEILERAKTRSLREKEVA